MPNLKKVYYENRLQREKAMKYPLYPSGFPADFFCRIPKIWQRKRCFLIFLIIDRKMNTAYLDSLIAIALCSIIANTLWIGVFLYQFRTFRAKTTRLIIFLHVSCLLQNLCSIPEFYTGNTILCEFMGFAHYYFGLIHIFSIVYLTIFYYSIVTDSWKSLVEAISSYGLIVAALFSLITLLPFMNNSYSAVDYFCTILDNYWAFLVFYFWVLSATFFCSVIYLCIYRFTSNHYPQYSKRLFHFLGVYILIAICAFIPRLAYRIVGVSIAGYQAPDIFSFISGVPMYIAGFAYCVNYYFSMNDMIEYERVTNLSGDAANQDLAMSLVDEFQSDNNNETQSLMGNPDL